MSEAVNHPQHYNKEGRQECIKEMEQRFGVYETIVFALLSAYKYIYRAGEKEDNSWNQDIEKAKWYIRYAEDLRVNMDYGFERACVKQLTKDIKEELANVES